MKILQYHFYQIQDEEDIIYSIILSPNEMNDSLKTIIYAPLCNQCAITPTTFLIDDKTRIRIDQISTVNKENIIKNIGKVDISQIPKIKETLENMLVK